MLCGKKTPVWHCKNALKDDHTCEFLFCHTCKDSKMEEMGDHRPKRAKSGQAKDYDDNQNDEKCCDHNIMRLEICDEGTYFEESYIQKKLDDNECYYATKCMECGASIRDKIPV